MEDSKKEESVLSKSTGNECERCTQLCVQLKILTETLNNLRESQWQGMRQATNALAKVEALVNSNNDGVITVFPYSKQEKKWTPLTEELCNLRYKVAWMEGSLEGMRDWLKSPNCGWGVKKKILREIERTLATDTWGETNSVLSKSTGKTVPSGDQDGRST